MPNIADLFALCTGRYSDIRSGTPKTEQKERQTGEDGVGERKKGLNCCIVLSPGSARNPGHAPLPSVPLPSFLSSGRRGRSSPPRQHAHDATLM